MADWFDNVDMMLAHAQQVLEDCGLLSEYKSSSDLINLDPPDHLTHCAKLVVINSLKLFEIADPGAIDRSLDLFSDIADRGKIDRALDLFGNIADAYTELQILELAPQFENKAFTYEAFSDELKKARRYSKSGRPQKYDYEAIQRALDDAAQANPQASDRKIHWSVSKKINVPYSTVKNFTPRR